jgi:hypothetical protein
VVPSCENRLGRGLRKRPAPFFIRRSQEAQMQQAQKIISKVDAQKMLAQYQASPVEGVTGAYKLPNGMLIALSPLPDGRVRMVITKGSCVC